MMLKSCSENTNRLLFSQVYTSACNGDNDGGMYFEIDGAYSLRDIVSLTVSRSTEANFSDPQEYVVFTDAARYLSSIHGNSK